MKLLFERRIFLQVNNLFRKVENYCKPAQNFSSDRPIAFCRSNFEAIKITIQIRKICNGALECERPEYQCTNSLNLTCNFASQPPADDTTYCTVRHLDPLVRA